MGIPVAEFVMVENGTLSLSLSVRHACTVEPVSMGG